VSIIKLKFLACPLRSARCGDGRASLRLDDEMTLRSCRADLGEKGNCCVEGEGTISFRSGTKKANTE
jgi:hypothetical protein